MKVYHNEQLEPAGELLAHQGTVLSPAEVYWIYNCLDNSVTSEVFDAMDNHAKQYWRTSYNFVRAMQGPAFTMTCRGIRVDTTLRDDLIFDLEAKRVYFQGVLNQFAEAVWDQGLNPGSPIKVKQFFYQVLKMPEQFKFKKGKKEISVDNEALEALEMYRVARPFCLLIKTIRDLGKKLGVLYTGIDADNRLRVGFNVVGTETGRWSSSANCWGTGTNGQNVTDELRKICVADSGWKMGSFDLEQAEARTVAYLAGDDNYIRACEDGDLHTTVCKMVWKDLAWTGVLEVDRALAEETFYRHFSRRDLAKRGGHGTNYYGKARTIARNMKVDVKLIDAFQASYFAAFPGIPRWHTSTAEQLQMYGFIDTPLGRRRFFLNRRDDDATLREAIAHVPQSTIGELLNEGLRRIWHEYDLTKNTIQILVQVHDAIYFQYREADEHWLLPELKSKLEIPFPVGPRVCLIPAGAPAVGWNWGKYDEIKNPRGLKKWKPKA